MFFFLVSFQVLTWIQADICQLGMDQRKVNMLAREYAEELKLKHKPVILSHREWMNVLFKDHSTFFGYFI